MPIPRSWHRLLAAAERRAFLKTFFKKNSSDGFLSWFCHESAIIFHFEDTNKRTNRCERTPRAPNGNHQTMAETILVVEDEPAIRELIGFACESSGYEVLRAGSVREASELLAQNRVHLILLDWMLPDLSGLQWLDKLKRDERHASLPVIMLTARGTESDKVAGLDAGADDYVVKPFSPRELIARMRAVLRRGGSETEKTITCGPLTINESRFSAKVNGEPVKLGVIEFKMLLVLASSPGRVYSRAQLLSRVWDEASELDERTVDVHILRLRKQLAGTAAAGLVETVRGLGYRANDAL